MFGGMVPLGLVRRGTGGSARPSAARAKLSRPTLVASRGGDRARGSDHGVCGRYSRPAPTPSIMARVRSSISTASLRH